MEQPQISNSKNLILANKLKAGGDVRIGDDVHYHIENLPFTVSHSRHFLSRITPDLLKTTIPCFDKYQGLVEDFFHNPHKRILLISGTSESGKTHFLRNLILEANQQQNWVCASIEPHMLGEHPVANMSEEVTLLLFKDDVDWQEAIFLEPVLNFINSHPNARLIFTVHHTWLAQVQRAIGHIKDLPGKVNHIQLEQWKTEYLLQILRLASNLAEVKFEQDIVRQFPNPYLLKYFGEAKAGNPQLDVLGVSRNFAEKIKRVFEQVIQTDLHAQQIQILTGCLIFGNSQGFELKDFASYLGIAEPTLIAVLERLKVAGIVRFRRGTWHIFPEIKGDFYLASQMEGQTVANMTEYLATHMAVNERATLVKVIGMAQYLSEASRTTLATYLHHLIDQWQKELQESITVLDRRRMEAVTEILHMEEYFGTKIATDTACIYIMSALSAQLADNKAQTSLADDANIEVIFSNSPTYKEYAKFLDGLIHIVRKRDEYLTILKEIWRSGWKTNTTNYNPEELTANAFKPANNTIDSYEKGLR